MTTERMTREEAILDSTKELDPHCFSKDEIECYQSWFRSGIDWAEQHPSRELVEKIVELARELGDGWESCGDFYYSIEDIMKQLEDEDETR